MQKQFVQKTHLPVLAPAGSPVFGVGAASSPNTAISDAASSAASAAGTGCTSSGGSAAGSAGPGSGGVIGWVRTGSTAGPGAKGPAGSIGAGSIAGTEGPAASSAGATGAASLFHPGFPEHHHQGLPTQGATRVEVDASLALSALLQQLMVVEVICLL